MIWNRVSSKLKSTEMTGALPAPGWRLNEAIWSGNRRVWALADLARMAARGRESDRLIDYVAEVVADQLEVKLVGIATWDECAKKFVFRGGRGWPSELGAGMKIPASPGLLSQRLFSSGKAMVIEDLRNEKRFKPPRGLLAQGAISGLIAPVTQRERPCGLIGAFSTAPRGFGPAVIDFFQTVANILSSALEIDRLRCDLRLATEAARREAALKTAFMANASHEIRSPLNVILGYWELISERLGEVGDANVPNWVAAVDRAGSRLVGTIDDILDFSRLEAGAVAIAAEALRIAPLIESVVRTATPFATAKKIGLSCAIDAPDLIVRSDRRSLEVALTKLVGNAIKFTARGAVSIRLAREPDRAARIEIADSGIGIAADYIPHLFEPFSQESANYARPFEGIGLGLAIARRYLELNGAQIAVRSAKGRGTTFTIRLPTAPVARLVSSAPCGDPADPSLRSRQSSH